MAIDDATPAEGRIGAIPFSAIDWRGAAPLIAESFVVGVDSMDVHDQLVVPGEFPPDVMAQTIERMPAGALALGALRRFVALGCGSSAAFNRPHSPSAERELEAAAEHTIERACRKAVDAATHEEAARLARAVRSKLRTFVIDSGLVTLDGAARRYGARAVRILENPGAEMLNSLLGELLGGVGDEGRALAMGLHDHGAPAWPWPWIAPTDSPTTVDLPWLRALAMAVWSDVVAPELERERKNPPALVHRVHADLAFVYSRARILEEKSGQRALPLDPRAPQIITATLDDSVLRALAERGARELGSMTGLRLLLWEIVSGNERAWSGEVNPQTLTVDGGWSTFAHDVLGLKAKNEAQRLRAIAWAQSRTHLVLPDGSVASSLTTLTEWAQRGRRRGAIQITLNEMLMPDYVHTSKKTGRPDDVRLVPIIPSLPPLIGGPSNHAPQINLSWLVTRELRLHARQLVEDAGVEITNERWGELAQEAALPTHLIGPVVDRWLHDGDDAPALLHRPAPGRFTLSSAHAREHAFLVDAGQRERKGSIAGQRSVDARGRKLTRQGKG